MNMQVVHNHTLIIRCNETYQVELYARMAKKIQYTINDTEIFRLTGCLSNCDKYHYTAQPRSEVKKTWTFNKPSTGITFVFPNGKNEVKEQVSCMLGNFQEI